MPAQVHRRLETTGASQRKPKAREVLTMPNPKAQLSNKQKVRLAALAAMPDSEIDTSDIPEDTDWSKGQRGKFLIQGKPRFKVQKRE